MAAIRVGIGGWNFPPWRGTFYPAGLPQAQELGYASRHVTSIEINATFYGSQKPESFRRWRDGTPEGFVFSVKGPRFSTHRRDLGECGDSIRRFLGTGVTELGAKLGPILWQFPPTRRYDPAAMQPFLDALPAEADGVGLRHVIEARHESFATPEWMAQLRAAGVAHAIVDSDKHVLLTEATAQFVYVRLERNAEGAEEGYDGAALDEWAARARAWSAERECFVYFISGDKVRAPHAAMAMLRRLGEA